MKTFYNVVNSLLCCAKEACAWIVLDIEWVQFVLQNCENCRIIGLNRAKKEQILSEVCMKKTAPHSTAYHCLKGWFTRHQICRQDLLGSYL